MCGLCGFLSYNDKQIDDIQNLTNALMESSARRGTDAAGIAFCDSKGLKVVKEGKSAYQINFKPPKETKALIGHTRHSTQGAASRSFNNHPFFGQTKDARFALAHNGIITNELSLRDKYKLPKTNIETDSYIVIQILEALGRFNYRNLKTIAENIRGSFTLSFLDDRRNIHLIKGDSPLHILHFPKQKLYVYASTENILWTALIETELFDSLKKKEYKEIHITEGDILTITSKGKLIWERFNYIESYSMYSDWRYYGHWGLYDDYCFEEDNTGEQKNIKEEYVSCLRNAAASMGVSPDDVETLIDEGFTLDEIEEYIYECAR